MSRPSGKLVAVSGRIAVGGLGTDPEKRTKTRRYLSDTVLRFSNDNTEICRGSYYAKRDDLKLSNTQQCITHGTILSHSLNATIGD